MNTTRLDQTKIHKLFIKAFTTIIGAEKGLGVSKVTLYKLCAGKGSDYNGANARLNKKLSKGFKNHTAILNELKKELGVD